VEITGVNRAEPPDAAGWFASRYGREPEGIWFAPGRVNLMGGPDYTEAFGALLTASHRSLRDQFRMSWPQADEAVKAAAGAGAAGARMTGGGFGGCVVALVPAGGAGPVARAVTERFARRGWPAPSYLAAVPSGAARRLR
jgi:galactokinase